MKLQDILTTELIKVPLISLEKTQIIAEMVDMLVKAERIKDRDQVLKAILDREAVLSTGVGDGVAIPHGKAEAAPEIVAALGIARQPVDFESIDDKPVSLVWLIVGPPSQTGQHLKALSRISRLVHERHFRERLIGAMDADEAYSTIRTEEQRFQESN